MKIKITQYSYIYKGVYYPGELIALADFSDETFSDKFLDVKILLSNNSVDVSSEKTSNLQKKA
jgi:hypothetical protein